MAFDPLYSLHYLLLSTWLALKTGRCEGFKTWRQTTDKLVGHKNTIIDTHRLSMQIKTSDINCFNTLNYVEHIFPSALMLQPRGIKKKKEKNKNLWFHFMSRFQSESMCRNIASKLIFYSLLHVIYQFLVNNSSHQTPQVGQNVWKKVVFVGFCAILFKKAT